MHNAFNMKAPFLLILFFLLSSYVSGQDIRYINLEYSTAVIPEYAYLKISIEPGKEETYHLKVESVSLIQKVDPSSRNIKGSGKSVDKEVILVKRQFQEIVNALQKIKQTDIFSGPHPSLLDGNSCLISYGALGSSVTYHVNTPGFQTHDRNLGDFLNAYKLILRTADIDPDKIL